MILKLTDTDSEPVLVGTESIIRAKSCDPKYDPHAKWNTEIESRHAMVCSTYVLETVEEIYAMINSPLNKEE